MCTWIIFHARREESLVGTKGRAISKSSVPVCFNNRWTLLTISFFGVHRLLQVCLVMTLVCLYLAYEEQGHTHTHTHMGERERACVCVRLGTTWLNLLDCRWALVYLAQVNPIVLPLQKPYHWEGTTTLTKPMVVKWTLYFLKPHRVRVVP